MWEAAPPGLWAAGRAYPSLCVGHAFTSQGTVQKSVSPSPPLGAFLCPFPLMARLVEGTNTGRLLGTCHGRELAAVTSVRQWAGSTYRTEGGPQVCPDGGLLAPRRGTEEGQPM